MREEIQEKLQKVLLNNFEKRQNERELNRLATKIRVQDWRARRKEVLQARGFSLLDPSTAAAKNDTLDH